MSKDVCLVGATSFRLLHGEHVDVEEVILGLIEKHMDGYGITLEMLHASDDGDRYVLELETEEVGHSFPERLESLVKDMSPHVLDAFSVTIREDVMSDDRDQVIYGGPSPGAIENFRIEHSVKEVQQYLGEVAVRAALLEVLLRDPQLKDRLPCVPKVFATVENGIFFQGILSTHPLDVTLINYDINGCDDDQLTPVPQGRGIGPDFVHAQVGPVHVEIDAERCAELSRAFEDEGNAKVAYLGFSEDGYWSNDLGWVEHPTDATQFDADESALPFRLMGACVSVLKVNSLLLSTLPTQDDLLLHIELIVRQCQGGAITDEDKAQLLEAVKGEFRLLNEDPYAFAPAVLALLKREQEASRSSAERPRG